MMNRAITDKWMAQVRKWAASHPQRNYLIDDNRELGNERWSPTMPSEDDGTGNTEECDDWSVEWAELSARSLRRWFEEQEEDEEPDNA